jgi:predicted nucleotidyltransferase
MTVNFQERIDQGNLMNETAIKKAAYLLHRAVPDATIILFGSQARGDAAADSDVDFLVVAPEVKSRRKEMARLSRLLRPLRISADVLVFSRGVFDHWAGIPGTVIHEAAKEGRVLYAAQ